MQKPLASAIIKKSTDGFLSVLAKQYRAKEGGLAACRSAKRFCNHSKNPRKDFLNAPTPDWKGGVARPPQAGRSGSVALESG